MKPKEIESWLKQQMDSYEEKIKTDFVKNWLQSQINIEAAKLNVLNIEVKNAEIKASTANSELRLAQSKLQLVELRIQSLRNVLAIQENSQV